MSSSIVHENEKEREREREETVSTSAYPRKKHASASSRLHREATCFLLSNLAFDVYILSNFFQFYVVAAASG